MQPRVAPSILSADFAQLRQEMQEACAGGADFFHIDVMDGHFVDNITIGAPVLKSLRPYFPEVVFDTHLMIESPEKFIGDFAKAVILGEGDRDKHYLTIHSEVTPHLHRALCSIRAAGLKAGVAINPGTPLSALDEVWDMIDILCLMSVNPGFGGQGFIESVKEKVFQARTLIQATGRNILVEVDGGVKVENIAEVAACGADVLVAGSEVFGKRKQGYTPEQMVRRLRAELALANPYEPVRPARV